MSCLRRLKPKNIVASDFIDFLNFIFISNEVANALYLHRLSCTVSSWWSAKYRYQEVFKVPFQKPRLGSHASRVAGDWWSLGVKGGLWLWAAAAGKDCFGCICWLWVYLLKCGVQVGRQRESQLCGGSRGPAGWLWWPWGREWQGLWWPMLDLGAVWGRGQLRGARLWAPQGSAWPGNGGWICWGGGLLGGRDSTGWPRLMEAAATAFSFSHSSSSSITLVSAGLGSSIPPSLMDRLTIGDYPVRCWLRVW